MLFVVLAGFALALFAPLIQRFTRDLTGWVLAIVPAAIFAYLLSLAPTIAQGETLRESYSWVPSMGVDLALRIDGLSLLMALIVSGVGVFIFIYGGGYLKGDVLLGRFYAFLSIFMAAMLGVALSDNLILLFVFWELTSISSYLLIGFKHNYEDSRKAALKALVITGAGGLAMLAGLILLALIVGSSSISEILAQGDAIRASSLYLPALILIAIGAFTKSAQFPFHSWLPGAMAAPTPVSAYLHSATMVKAGVFLLARLSPSLGGTPEWVGIVTTFGAVTMLMGGLISLKQTDLKRILAFSTISSLGMMVMLLGLNNKVAIEAAMLFMLTHSLYKGALFMIAGTIDHETGTRDVTQLGGLYRVLPMVALSAALAALSMSGIPPLIGFISKELTYEATLGYPDATTTSALLITAVAVLANMATIAVAILTAFKPFVGEQHETPKHPHPAPLSLWIGSFTLGLLSVGFGLFALPVGEYLVGPAASAVYGKPIELELALWHGINPMLILSIITIVGGVLVYWRLSTVKRLVSAVDAGERIGPDRIIGAALDGLPTFAQRVTRLTQSGYLRQYVGVTIGVTVALVGYLFIRWVTPPALADLAAQFDDFAIYETILAVVMLGAVLLVLSAKTLLFMIASLGVIGFSQSLLFVLHGAPDLAMTQFSIETLSVVLFVLMLYRLPDLAHASTRLSRFRDTLIAASAGGLVTVLILTVTSVPLDSPLTQYFVENSLTKAKGANIVNVILVDFRGFDTLGEITVLATASIGVYAMLKLRKRPEDTINGEGEHADEIIPDAPKA